MKTTWVTVALFVDLPGAKTLEAFLREKRIEARTYNDKALKFFLFLCPPQTTFQVQVSSRILKMAEETVSLSPPAILQGAVHCPECGSLRISYPHLTRNSFLPTVRILFGLVFHLVKHQAYCENCHCLLSWGESPKTAPPQPMAHPGQ